MPIKRNIPVSYGSIPKKLQELNLKNINKTKG
jgi:hypothetical protein